MAGSRTRYTHILAEDDHPYRDTRSSGIGMSAGPFFGGLLTKIGFRNEIFNGYTSPGWIMAVIWIVFWICVLIWFEDVPEEDLEASVVQVEASPDKDKISASESESQTTVYQRSSMTLSQWGVIVCMCWFAMTCFFILGTCNCNCSLNVNQG